MIELVIFTIIFVIVFSALFLLVCYTCGKIYFDLMDEGRW